jgi:hypothetical protein
MIQVRQIKSKEIDEISPWYAARGDGFLHDWLPQETGFVAYDARGLVASAFLILTNSKLCFMEYMMTNPDRSEIDQGKGLLKLAFSLEKLSKSMGYKVILGLVPEDHFSLAKFYNRQKARPATKLMRLYYKGL